MLSEKKETKKGLKIYHFAPINKVEVLISRKKGDAVYAY